MIPTFQRGNPQGNNFPHCHHLCGIEMKTVVVTCSHYGSPEKILPLMQQAGIVRNSSHFARLHDVFMESSVSFDPSGSYLESHLRPQKAESIAATLPGTQQDNLLYRMHPATAASHRANGRLTVIGALFGAAKRAVVAADAKKIRLSNSNCRPKSTYFKPRSTKSQPVISRSN